MANDHNSLNAEPEMNLEDLTRCLERVFENRRANAAGSSSISQPVISPLCETLIGLVSNHTSPRKPNGVRVFSFPARGRCHGISPSPSASSDSSDISGFLSVNSRDVDRNNSSTVRQLTAAASARPIYGRGPSRSDCIAQVGTQPRVLGQEAVELIPNSSIPAPTTSGHGGTGIVCPSPPIPGGVLQTKTPKKRKRQSRKPFTRNVEASVDEFRATVQQFTGFKGLEATVVYPQPVQVANAVPIAVGLESRNPAAAARPGSSSTSTMSAVHSPSPTVSDQVPEAGFSIRGREASVCSDSSKSSSLNECMGYGRPTPQFLEDQNYDENLGQLPVDTLQPASDCVHRRMSKPMPTGATSSTGGRTSASRSAGTDVEEAAPLPSEGMPRDESFSGSGLHLGFNSPISHSRMGPSPIFVFNNRPMEMSSFEMEFEPEDWPLAFLNDIYQ